MTVHRSGQTGLLTMAVLCGMLISPGVGAAEPTTDDDAGNLAQRFVTPDAAGKPWTYWWWINGNVDKATITRDLEQMKDKGFAGLLLFDARGYHDDHCPPPPPRMEFMSSEWRELVRFAMAEAHRLGLKMSINLSSCAGALKGPWLVKDDAPKRLIWTAAEVPGPGPLQLQLAPSGDAGFRDVALLALKTPRAAGTTEATAATAAERLSSNWREIQPERDGDAIVSEVVDLSENLDEHGQLAWVVPDGDWTVVRFARTVMAGHEYDVDVLDPAAVAGHFDRIGRSLIEDAGPAARTTLTHFYSVSWEGAAPTWTGGFETQFEKYRGYSPRRYLPVLAGRTVTSPEVSTRFLRDYYKTLGDLFRDNFYGQLQALCREHGLAWHSESGGPWNRKLAAFQHADQLAFLARNDMPQGEFWHKGHVMNRPAAMAAHVYGKRLAATEAFTHMRTHWSAYPAVLKQDADSAFVDGVNHFIWHTFTCSPPEFGKPGIEYFAGTHLNPNVTWFQLSGGFLTYLARCQIMLRQGLFAADVCCYTGDKPYLHWGRGEKWSEQPSLGLGKGYTYDLINDEVLLERLSVRDGKLVLPDGMSYRLLAVDLVDDAVAPQTLRRIAELAKAGATVVLGTRRPTRALGLHEYPDCDAEVRQLADELWNREGTHALGQGEIVTGRSLHDVLQSHGVLPDFEGNCEFIHRQLGDMDVYFVSGSGTAECVFRVSGKQPELWCPRTGAIRDAACYHPTDDGRTVVPVTLPQGGAVFVVFRKPAVARRLVTLPAPGIELVGRDRDRLALRLWDNEEHELTTADAKRIAIKPAQRPRPQEVAGAWEVQFDPEWGGPESIIFDRLVPWNDHASEGIKYYSGTATYRKTLQLTQQQIGGLVRLQLGQVGHVAEIRLNGQLLGTVWCEPWSVDLTGAAREGENLLEIDVANLWMNRLIGDSMLPPEQRRARSNMRFFRADDKYRAFEGFSPKDPLAPSGLIGPVRLEFGQEVKVDLDL